MTEFKQRRRRLGSGIKRNVSVKPEFPAVKGIKGTRKREGITGPRLPAGNGTEENRVPLPGKVPFNGSPAVHDLNYPFRRDLFHFGIKSNGERAVLVIKDRIHLFRKDAHADGTEVHESAGKRRKAQAAEETKAKKNPR
jgi:hypothetical protein